MKPLFNLIPLFVGILLLSACQNSASSTTAEKAEIEVSSPTLEAMDSTMVDSTLMDTTMTDTLAEADVEVNLDYEAWAKLEGLTVSCGGEMTNLSVPVNEIATRLEAQKLDYDVKPFTDCSGIFHRVLDSMGRRCPQHNYPSPETHRSSRDIGKWYNEKGAFVQIQDAKNQSEYIKPGAVMFYGAKGKDPKTTPVEDLFKSGGIRHIGVIVNVEKDEAGTITGYWLFHGRTKGKVAAITKYHKREYRNRPNYPAYGNGSDPWIGVAPLVADM